MEHSACIDALQDLIQINNDRIQGYTKAIDELKDEKDSDLKSLFSQFINDSEGYKSELTSLLQKHGGEVPESSTISGKIYRAWMDVKAVFTGHDRQAVLDNCEDGEDAAQKAYQMVLDDDDVMAETKALVSSQKALLKQAHDKIRSLRDVA